jgi:molecular chaperone HscA
VADLLETCTAGEAAEPPVQKALREDLRRATDALNAATTEFAARRMNARVRTVLSGRSLDEIAS